MSDLKMAREAMADKFAPMIEESLWSPASGPIDWTDEKIAASKERARDLANGLAGIALSAPEAAPASPSTGAWTEVIEAAKGLIEEAVDVWDYPEDYAHIARLKAALSTLNATSPAQAGAPSREAPAPTNVNADKGLEPISLAQPAAPPSREAIARVIQDKIRLAPLVEDGVEVGAEIVGMHEAADAIRSLYPTPPTPAVKASREAIGEVAELIVRDVCELPDRTSPEDWPEALLVTGEELHELIVERFAEAMPLPPAPDAHLEVGREEDQKRRAVPLKPIEVIGDGTGFAGAEPMFPAPPAPAQDEETSHCMACLKPMQNGDLFYMEVNTGAPIHAACCGPEREGFVNGEGDPIGPNEPIPEPDIWTVDDETKEGGAS